MINDLSNLGLNSCCQLYMLGTGLVSFVFVFQSVWDLVLKKSKRLSTVKKKKKNIRESTQFLAFVRCVCECMCVYMCMICIYIFVCVYIVCVCHVCIWMYCLGLYVYICVCNVCACICVQMHVVARYFTRVSRLRCRLLYFLLYSLNCLELTD